LAIQRRAEAVRRKAQVLCHAPPSIASIPTDAGDSIEHAGAVIRPIGCSRRVFLLKPYLTPDEIEGLAYRLRVLSANEALNSVLIATDDDDPVKTNALPSMAVDADALRPEENFDGFLLDPAPNQMWHAAGGYDPVAFYKSGHYKDKARVASLLDSVQDLALATRGHATKSRIPVITIPHGLVNDGGYAFCLSTYMIATEQTHFRILNPSRGLTFDPVGFSYILPRLGHEFRQASAEYRGCGDILALTGYEANANDMVETGLATHYMEHPTSVMGMLERTLSQLPPWNQQNYTKVPTKTEAQRQQLQYVPPEEQPDHNARFRNVAVASTIHAFTNYHADARQASMDMETQDTTAPAAFDYDPLPWHEERESDLVDIAATFDEIFKQHSVEGMMEGLNEVATRTTTDPEVQEGIDVAKDLLQRMERQAPLALKVTHRLMELGRKPEQTLVSCMKREKMAQINMMTKPDYENWCKAQLTTTGSHKMETFTKWQHRTVRDVSEDEVSEIIALE